MYYTNIIAVDAEGQQQEEKVVELNSLWKILTGKQGDRAVDATKRVLGLDVDDGQIPTIIFPDKTGPAKNKMMPCANAHLLKKLLSGLDASILEEKQDFVKKVLVDLGHPVVGKVASRFAKFNIISDDNAVSIVKEDDGTPRFVLFSVIKMFAPSCSPANIFYRNGVMKYLEKCGVKLPEGLADAESSDSASASYPANCLTWDLNDNITDYEKMLGAKSSGLVWGHSTYDKGSRTLHGDLPVFILVMMKLRTREARQFQGQALHQGVVMMGGNDQVALAISKHWRDERENATPTTQNQPWKELLQFFGEAVSATVEEAAPPPSLVVATRTEEEKIQAVVDKAINVAFDRFAEGHRVYESINSTGSSLKSRQYLEKHGLNLSEEAAKRAYQAQKPLHLRDFLAERLESNQMNLELAVRLLPHFSQEVKYRRLQQFAHDENDVFFIYWKLGEFRIAYTEVDRDLMAEVWELQETQDQLDRLERIPRKVRGTGGNDSNDGPPKKVRTGPYSSTVSSSSAQMKLMPTRLMMSSGNVTRENVHTFFAPRSSTS